MGMGVGGADINMHEGFVSLPYYPPASMTEGIVINDKGQRFINEDVYHGRLGSFVLQQQSERIYFIVTVDQYGDYEQVSYLTSPPDAAPSFPTSRSVAWTPCPPVRW